jgi:hypothetical protein
MGVIRLQDRQVAHVSIELDKGGTLSGVVRVQTAGGLLPFVGERVLLDNSEIPVGPTGSASCDASGRFAFRDLFPSERYSLTFLARGRVPDNIEDVAVQRDAVTEISHTLDHTNVTGLRGVIRIGEQSAASGYVTLRRMPIQRDGPLEHFCPGEIDDDGSYSCQGAVPGQYQVEIEAWGAAGTAASTAERIVTIEAGELLTLDVDLPAPQ